MADAALFEFLHMEMVAELWSHHSDLGPGVSAGPRGEKARAATGRPSLGPGEHGGRSNGPGGTPAPPLPRWALAPSSVKWGSLQGRPRGLLPKASEEARGQEQSSRPSTESAGNNYNNCFSWLRTEDLLPGFSPTRSTR